MATNRKLRTELLTQLGCTASALSQRAQVIKKKYGPMSTEEAVYIIAHQHGFDLSRYVDAATVQRIRDILTRNPASESPPIRVKNKGGKTTYIKIGNDLPEVDVLLSTTLAEDAAKMARIYPIYYVLENSLRVTIKRVLDKKYGTGWWEKHVPTDPKNRVKGRKDDEVKKPWHCKRGQHEIFYSDFKDLKSIINANREVFAPIFLDLEWISQKLSELELPRNIVAHHNPLDSNDIKRIEVIFEDWKKLLREKRHLI